MAPDDPSAPRVSDGDLAVGTRWQHDEEWGFVPDADGYFPPHREACFGCGPENEHGLRLRVRDAGDGTLVCNLRFPERFQGGPGVAHGGAIAAVLDDVLGTVGLALGQPAVTGRITVTYRRPVVLGQDVEVRAWKASESGRKIVVKGELRDSLGRVLAEGEALMVVIQAGHFSRFAAELPPEEDVPEGLTPFLPGENYP